MTVMQFSVPLWLELSAAGLGGLQGALYAATHVSGSNFGRSRCTAFGRPVVPDVYCMNWPATRSSGVVSG